VGTWLHRSLIILTLACAPIVTLWTFTERLLLAVGQDPRVAAMTGAFILCAGTAWQPLPRRPRRPRAPRGRASQRARAGGWSRACSSTRPSRRWATT